MNEPRTYSINLAAYVMTATMLMPEIKLDSRTNTYYMVFPRCHAVDAAINDFRTNSRLEVNVRKFLDAVNYIRRAMHKGGERGAENE
ncbi:MAG: hypothetical protein MJZ55_00170 [Paludibacteraceae bacterium]|nr:hypothetical protein [Paludibacteraceae bacterium]